MSSAAKWKNPRGVIVRRAKYTSKPTRTDIRETKKLLAQFGLRGVEIPELPTYCALERWRREYIVRYLDEEVRDD